MAYNVYPGLLPASLSGTGTTGDVDFAFLPFTSLDPPDGDGYVMMYLRAVTIGGGAAPVFTLRWTDGTDSVTLNPVVDSGTPSSAFMSDFTEVSAEVTSIAVVPPAQPAYRIDLRYHQAWHDVGQWSLEIDNNSGGSRQIMWIAASTTGETQVPWLYIDPAAGDLAALNGCVVLAGDTDAVDIELFNYGTSPANFADSGDVPLGSGFTMLGVPATLASGDSAIVQASFTAPAAPGEANQNWAPAYNDPGATDAGSPVPADDVDLHAEHGRVEIAYVADASGSMARTPDGSTTPVGATDSRWDLMVDALDGFMTILQMFAGDKGHVSVVIFPDITGITPSGPAAPAASHLEVFDGDISATLAADVAGALSAFHPLNGKGGTALIRAVIETMSPLDPPESGEFDSSTAAQTYNNRFMVVLTDGFNNVPPNVTELQPGGASAGDFPAKAIDVFGVAFGEDAAGVFEVDHSIVQAIVDEAAPGTGIFRASTATMLDKTFQDAVAAGLCNDYGADPTGRLTPAMPKTHQPWTVLRKDRQIAIIVTWDSVPEVGLEVELRRPDGVVVSEADADGDANIHYRRTKRRVIISMDREYLGDPNDPANFRYGTWSVCLRRTADGESDAPIDYEWSTMVRSGLRLHADVGTGPYHAGDPIVATTRLSSNGRPVVNASVWLHVEYPINSAVNWLASAKVSPHSVDRARTKLAEMDVNRVGVKALAAELENQAFTPRRRTEVVPMREVEDGIYRAAIDDTTLQGSYRLYMVAVGDDDGVCFRREVSRDVLVTPAPAIQPLGVVYRLDRATVAATVIVDLTDRYGNKILVDPDVDPRVKIALAGHGKWAGELEAPALDGVYTRTLEYPAKEAPVIGLEVDGVSLGKALLAPLARLDWAEAVVAHEPAGRKQDNRHRDPEAALGDPFERGGDEFLALGAGGSVVLTAKRQLTGSQITVIAREHRSGPRPYKIEVRARGKGWCDRWVEIGRSRGHSQTFEVPCGLHAAAEIRITDESGVARLDAERLDDAPGAGIRGVGVLRRK